jgi:NAD(P)-dependent dehydrogenase (short-subunit alcohol dehydrogenase family)
MEVTEKVKPKPQSQEMPGEESRMEPKPIYDNEKIKGSGKLMDKVAVITGGDSGIGRAVAVLFAKEGADVAIVYLNEHDDANETKQNVEKYGRKCLLIPGELDKEDFCNSVIERVVQEYGKIDILINNAGTQIVSKRLEDISSEQLIKTFSINIFSMFWLTKAALKHMKEGSTIVNTYFYNSLSGE